MRILVVDDDDDARDLITGALMSAGYVDIVTAASAWEALLILDVGRTSKAAPPVDIVLLDVVMPEMDGVQACKRIRSAPQYADLPIIMLTSLDDGNSVVDAFLAGATDYITKPLNLVELIARVRTARSKVKAEAEGSKDWEKDYILNRELTRATISSHRRAMGGRSGN